VTIAFLCFLPAAVFIAAANGHPPHADGQWFMEVAQSLARGRGFSQMQGIWPGKPTAWHPPLWPFFESLVMRSSVSSVSAVHIAGLFFHAATILGAVLLAWLLSGRARATWCAGLAVGLWPGALMSIIAGWSEPCAGAVMTLGSVLICMGRKWFWSGALTLSTMPLVRPEYLVFPLLAAAIGAIVRFRSPETEWKALGGAARLTLGALLFYLPSAAWVARNYVALGAFPVLATETGSVLFGAYNPISAKWGPEFATHLTPNVLPEENLHGLARTMSEAEVDRHWQARGKQFIREHWRSVPGLLLGHTVQPLQPQPQTMKPPLLYPEWICRIALYAAAIILAIRKPLPLDSWYGLLLGAAVLSTAIVVVAFEASSDICIR
jgi:hypothetical protein